MSVLSLDFTEQELDFVKRHQDMQSPEMLEAVKDFFLERLQDELAIQKLDALAQARARGEAIKTYTHAEMLAELGLDDEV